MKQHIAICLACLLAACGGSDLTSPPTRTASSLSLVAAVSGYYLANDTATVVFHVMDQSVKNVPGARVDLLASGGTLIGGSSATTSADGTATIRWVLPSTSATLTLTGSVVGIDAKPVFTASVNTSLRGTWRGPIGTGIIQISIQSHSVTRSGTCALTGIGVLTLATGDKDNLTIVGDACGGKFNVAILPFATYTGTVQTNDTTLVGGYGVASSSSLTPLTLTRISPVP